MLTTQEGFHSSNERNKILQPLRKGSSNKDDPQRLGSFQEPGVCRPSYALRLHSQEGLALGLRWEDNQSLGQRDPVFTGVLSGTSWLCAAASPRLCLGLSLPGSLPGGHRC